MWESLKIQKQPNINVIKIDQLLDKNYNNKVAYLILGCENTEKFKYQSR